ncbi:1394_t:CDS:1 [Funneliformis caledonium]|uniref:1394_t:CDS:1 n=1 Tax=Funneliformis caledonium TaxID=1117310 RepID=A0A9N9DL71_9GLOM|nr:1394_t:CDS:1 [Funneliformis caledonium]
MHIETYAHTINPTKFKNHRRGNIIWDREVILEQTPETDEPKCIENEVTTCSNTPKNEALQETPKEPPKEDPKTPLPPPKEEPKNYETPQPKEVPKEDEPSPSSPQTPKDEPTSTPNEEPKKDESSKGVTKNKALGNDETSKGSSATSNESHAEHKLDKLKSSVIIGSVIGIVSGVIIFVTCFAIAYVKHKNQEQMVLLTPENNDKIMDLNRSFDNEEVMVNRL